MAKKIKYDKSVMGKNIGGVMTDIIDKGFKKEGKKRTVDVSLKGKTVTDLNKQKMMSTGVKTKAVMKNGVITRKKVTDYSNNNGSMSGTVTKTKFKKGMPKKEVKKDYVTGRLISKKKY